MGFERRSYTGGAPATSLQAGISSANTAFDGMSGSGYPDGGGGPYAIVIGRGLANEEKILIASLSGTTFTVASSGRGYDNTAASAHSAGETIEVCATAIDFDEANAHVTDDTRDDHSQYLNITRHDATVRHVFGGALPTPGAPAAIGTANAAGSASGPPRSDHVHKIGAGAINATNMFTSASVPGTALVDAGVPAGKLANDAVVQANMADASVGTAELVDANVTLAKMASGSVDSSKVVDGSITGADIAATTVTHANLAADAAKSADVAWGFIAQGFSTANQNNQNSDGEVNVTGATVTFTAVANRRYRYTATLPGIQGKTASGAYELKVTDGGGSQVSTGSFARAVLAANDYWSPCIVVQEDNPGAGSTTRKLRFVALTAGSSNADLNGSAAPGFILVEDIGPA